MYIINSEPNKERCILRIQDVIRRTGYKRTHIYNLMRAGKFPKSIALGARAVGWDSTAVDQWIDQRIEATNSSSEDSTPS